MNAKQLIAERLGLAPDALKVDRIGLSQAQTVEPGHADPVGINAASEVVQTITRPDRSTLDPDHGNRVHDLAAVETAKRLDFSQRDPANPLGRSLTGGFYV